MSATKGICTFNDLKIISIGTYEIKVSSTIGYAIISNTISYFEMSQVLSYISISESTTTPTVYFVFDITIDAYQANNDFYTIPALYSLTIDDGSTIGGYSSEYTSTGTYVFSIYLVSVGLRTITATVNNVNTTVTLNVTYENFKISLSTTVNFI